MSAKNEKTHVDSVSVSLDAGLELAASQFELSLEVNSIPRITIELLPIEAKKGSFGASAPTFGEITALYNKLSSISKNLDNKANIKISVTSYGSKNSEQKIELKDWILSDVGLSSVTSYSAPTIAAIFNHPSYRLVRTGTIYENPNDSCLDIKLGSVSGGNIISLMDGVYKKFSSEILFYDIGKSVEHGKDVADVRQIVKKFRTDLAEANNLPGTYIDCSSSLFLEKHFTGDKKALLVTALANIAQPFFASGSTWHRIVQSICPACLMHVVPTYTLGKLKLEPAEPWQNFSYEIPESCIESIELPPEDPDPLIGVAVQRDNMSPDPVSDDCTTRREQPFSSKYAFYIPEGVNPESPQGRIEFIGDSTVITCIEQMNACPLSESASDDSTKHTRTLTKIEDLIGAEDNYAQAMFELLYRKNCTAAVTTTMMFNDSKGNVIHPGRTMRISEKSSASKVLFTGYLVKTFVRGAVGGPCVSIYTMTHTRPSGDARSSILIPDGASNPCY